jgi:hypothetical protein
MNGSAIIGIDLSKRAMQVCVVDRWGAVIEEGRVARPASSSASSPARAAARSLASP